MSRRHGRTCFACGKPVLGLAGMDMLLDSFYLDEEPDSRNIIRDKQYGPVHNKCLMSSTYRDAWINRLTHHFASMGKGKVFQGGPLRGMCFLPANRELIVILKDCVHLRLSDDDVIAISRQPEPEGFRLAVTEDIAIQLPRSEDSRLLARDFRKAGEIEVRSLIGLFSLDDLVSRPIGMAHGVVRKQRSLLSAAEQDEYAIEGTAAYFIPLVELEFEAIRRPFVTIP